jgi:hypothetical protein
MGTNAFIQSSKPDLHISLDTHTILKNISPEPVNSRGYLGSNKKDLSKVLWLVKCSYLSAFFFLSIPLRTTLITDFLTDLY